MALIPDLRGHVSEVTKLENDRRYGYKLILTETTQSYPAQKLETPQTVLIPKSAGDLDIIVGSFCSFYAFPVSGNPDTWESEAHSVLLSPPRTY